MKKFTVTLSDGKKIIKWAKSAAEALEKAEADYPKWMITGVSDNSPFNNIEIKSNEPQTNGRT